MRLTTRTTRLVAAGAIAALAAAVLAGCSSGGSGGGSAGGGGGEAIPIGQVGAYTGQVPGLSTQGKGFEAWVKYVNDQGGVAGHKIDLYTGDSKGDPTTEVSQMAQIYAQHRVVAFAGMGTFNLASSLSFVDKQKIPVIGGNNSDIVWSTSPYLYQQGTGVVPMYLAGFSAVPDGKTKAGLVYCKESPGCTQVHSLMFDQGLSKAAGGDPVYAAEVSLAAPSFTAQCIAAQQAGVQVLAVAMDGTNLLRLVKDCHQQGYDPTYAIGGTIANDEEAASGLMQGSLSAQSNAPWFLTDGPMGTMHDAMQKYEPDTTIDSGVVEGWASGLILGKAIENAAASGKLTSADILSGLAKIKDETFDGVTPPLTFTDSGVQQVSNCWYPISVDNGKWTAADGLKTTCASDDVLPTLEAATKALSS